ncbi:MAG: RagB/SusD family nutrient uptake outer membrane protein [Flavobacteriaceae bacterium]|nr:RagB/SusD family nutrient uptake outer membrane protein [Flavobacteriaceae bacterium]PHX77490.1 MAG: RagB/SusD family nutrient uptake outer membrane protein [Flavobacteriales bacterium]
MKKTILFTFVCGLLLLPTYSCKKFLDVDPAYIQDADNFFNTPVDYQRALTGAYDLMQGSFMSVWIGEIASDNTIAGGESMTDTKGLHELDDMSHGAVNQELRNVFRWNYAGITRVNFIMENKNKIDFPGKEGILAQASFLRAFYYFELVKFFGDVPLVVDKRLGAVEVTTVDRAPRADVYKQIESDLNYAISKLDWMVAEKGRISKGAALAMLGKVQLYQDKFDEAAVTFQTLIDQNMYSLIPNYNQLFTVANEGHKETIFDVEYTGAEGGGYGCLICLEGNAGPGFQGIRQYKGPIYGDGNSYNLPTKNLYDAFGAGDIRRDATILDIDAFIAKQAKPQDITYARGAGGHTGYYNNKYIKKEAEIGLPDNDLTSPVNYKVIRYADVLLMAAEANARKSSSDESKAKTYLNLVRKRVNLSDITTSGQTLVSDIWNERRLELACEGHRYFDLVRTKQAATTLLGFVTGKHELFPLPQVEIDLAGGNWNQNSGY